jgi:hypothetical protein
MTVPSNLVPIPISALPTPPVPPQGTDLMLLVQNGTTYQSNIASIFSSVSVPSSRIISSGTGLGGGGNLTADRNLYILPTGVTPNVYGSSTQVPVLTVNAQGQITNATTTPFSVAFSNITGKPTTLAGYGITDAQPLSNNLTGLAGLGTAGLIVNQTGGSYVTRSIAAGAGLVVSNGDGISGNPTISMPNQSVVPGNYGSSSFIPVITVDQQGRIAAIGVAPSGQGGTVTEIDTGTGLTGGPITISGTISLANTTVTANSYGSASVVPTFTVNAQGQLTAAANATISIPASAINTAIPNAGLANSSITINGNTVSLGGSTTITASTTGTLTFGTGLSGGSFNGSTNNTIAIANTAVTAASYGSSTAIPTFTVNAQGQLTAASTAAVIAPAGTLSGTTLNPTVVSSSLTSVGTIATGVWNGTAITVPYGGTGATSLTGYVYGNGTSAMTASTTIPNTAITGLGTMSTQNANSVAITGGTATLTSVALTTGTITTAPVGSTDIVNKSYVDSVAQGLNTKAPVLVATTANITLSGEQTIDGITTSSSRVLVKNQTTSSQNGIYVSSSGAWTRSSDANTWNQLVSAYVFVEEGTLQADTGWVCTVDPGGTLGVTAVTWAQFSGAGTYTAGTGLTLSGTQFSITNTAVSANSYGSSTAIPTFTVNAQGQLTAASTAAVIAPAETLTGTTLASNVVSSSLTSVGTISSGTWNGTAIGPTYGGTGLTSYVTGDLLYASSTNTLSRLAATTNGYVLTLSGGVPVWAAAASTGVTSISFGTTGLTPSTATTGAITVSGTLAVANGGTGVTASSGVNSVVLRDSNANITGNNFFTGFTSVAASGTTITMTAASTPVYVVTGSGGQTITLPNATTLPNGAIFSFNNNQSSGAITVQNTSATTVLTVQSGAYGTVVLLSNGTSAGTWDTHFQVPSNASWSTNTLSWAGSYTSGTWNGNAIGTIYGGTGQTSYTVGDLLYASATNALSKLSAGTSGYALVSNGASSAPSYQQISLTAGVTGTLPIANGGTGATTVSGAQTNLQVDPAGTAVAMSIALG